MSMSTDELFNLIDNKSLEFEEYPSTAFSNKSNYYDEAFMNFAINVSKLSSCSRLQVGSVIRSVDNRPILSGYNGTPSGMFHCKDYFHCLKWDDFDHKYRNIEFGEFMKIPEVKDIHGKFSNIYEVHAEQNLVAIAAKRGISIDKSHLYVTHSPCNNCSKLIIQSGISKVTFLHLYDREVEGIKLMIETGIEVEQLILNKGEMNGKKIYRNSKKN